jgi:uncharacterized membrane protein
MNDLFAIHYSDPNGADLAMRALSELSRRGKIELEDACAVVKDDKGHVHLHQERSLTLTGSLVGLAIGTILGWFVLVPYLGIPAAMIGALVGKFTDHGIEDNKMKDLSSEMNPNSSTLFFLMRGPEIDIVLQELAQFGGRIFHTSLDKYNENALEEKLGQLRNLYQTESENPNAVRIEEIVEVDIKYEEVVVGTEENTPGTKYRVVWYYTQWPQGSEYRVIGRGLSLEEAEELREKKDPHIKGENVLIEEDSPTP